MGGTGQLLTRALAQREEKGYKYAKDYNPVF